MWTIRHRLKNPHMQKQVIYKIANKNRDFLRLDASIAIGHYHANNDDLSSLHAFWLKYLATYN